MFVLWLNDLMNIKGFDTYGEGYGFNLETCRLYDELPKIPFTIWERYLTL